MTSAARRLWLRLTELVDRGRQAPVMAMSHRTRGNVVTLAWRLEVSSRHRAAATRALAAAVGAAAPRAGTALGYVRVEAGEEPVLFTLAPRVDVVAESASTVLARPAGHHLWLGLEPGCFLAEVVDPCQPFDANEAELAAVLAGGRVRCALVVRSFPAGARQRFLVELHGPRAAVGSVLRGAWPSLATLRALVTARNSAPAAPKVTVKSKL